MDFEEFQRRADEILEDIDMELSRTEVMLRDLTSRVAPVYEERNELRSRMGKAQRVVRELLR